MSGRAPPVTVLSLTLQSDREASRPSVRWRSSRPASSSPGYFATGDDRRCAAARGWIAGTIAAISLERAHEGRIILRLSQPSARRVYQPAALP
jgi:hypothetical protein